jgi:hypothetical protein
LCLVGEAPGHGIAVNAARQQRSADRPVIDPQVREQLRAFYIAEDRKRDRRKALKVAALWLFLAGSIAALCWSALK